MQKNFEAEKNLMQKNFFFKFALKIIFIKRKIFNSKNFFVFKIFDAKNFSMQKKLMQKDFYTKKS